MDRSLKFMFALFDTRSTCSKFTKNVSLPKKMPAICVNLQLFANSVVSKYT